MIEFLWWGKLAQSSTMQFNQKLNNFDTGWPLSFCFFQSKPLNQTYRYEWQSSVLSQKYSPHQEQQIWSDADGISLDYRAHFTGTLILDAQVPGLVRHADGDGGRAGSLRRIIVCGIWKGHLQEALDMTSSASICMLWLLCGLNITDGFRTTGATGHFSVEAAKSYPHR